MASAIGPVVIGMLLRSKEGKYAESSDDDEQWNKVAWLMLTAVLVGVAGAMGLRGVKHTKQV
eukprot:3787745-Ditylum_brightwellii.AAC.1